MIRAFNSFTLWTLICCQYYQQVSSFPCSHQVQRKTRYAGRPITTIYNRPSIISYRESQKYVNNNQEKELKAEEEEEVRIKILGDRRKQIRSALKAAESMRNMRIKNGWVPEVDENGKPLKSDGKLAVSLTAFMVAGGAVALRVGGRAALISGLGLNFVTDNPEIKENLDQILMYTDNMDPLAKAAAFVAAWTAVKIFCVDFAGVALV